jgi:hypothetical protein
MTSEPHLYWSLASGNSLPVDIAEVSVLRPYFYRRGVASVAPLLHTQCPGPLRLLRSQSAAWARPGIGA